MRVVSGSFLAIASINHAFASTRNGGANNAPLLLISFDGFRADYLNRTATPNFDALAAEGVRVTQGLTPAFVTKTFPDHWTLMTGLWEESHGIVGNRMIDPEFPGESFNMSTVEHKWWDGAEPLWRTVERQGGKAATAFWPGSDAYPPSYTMGPYNQSVSYQDRVTAVVGWLNLPPVERPDLICLYFEEPDSTGHAFGPDSEEVTAAIAAADSTLGEIITGLTEAGLWGASGASSRVNVIVTSDHGMATISPERVITLSDFVDTSAFVMPDTSPVACIWPLDPTQASSIAAQLRESPHLSVYEKPGMPASLHYNGSNRIAPVIAIADEGYSIRADETTDAATFCCGTHGYEGSLPSMRPIFLARGPGFRRGILLTHGAVDSVHVHPLMAHLMGLLPDLMGPTNGSLEAVQPLLLRSDDQREARWVVGGEGFTNENGQWLPSQRRISIAPAAGADFLAGSVVDVLVTVPAVVLAAEAAAGTPAPSPSPALRRRETPMSLTVDGVDILQFCSTGRVAGGAAAGRVPAPARSTVFSDALGATVPADDVVSEVLYQSMYVRRCVMPTLAVEETNRTLTVVASVSVGGVGGVGGGSGGCGFRVGCGSGVVRETVRWTVRSPPAAGARNAILFVADGMSLPMLSAARAAVGAASQVNGKLSRTFPTDGFERMGLVRTQSLEALVTDSFASASAYWSGHKTIDGAGGVYPDATADFLDDPRVETLAEYVRRHDPNWGLGVVTTSDLTDATPAAVWGHSVNRYTSAPLAQQALDLPGGPPQVLLGGGRQWFGPLLPQLTPLGFESVNNASALCAIADCDFGLNESSTRLVEPGAAPDRLIGLFSEGTMATYLDRNVPSLRAAAEATSEASGMPPVDPAWEQAGLAQMASAALAVLARNSLAHPRTNPGFLLMVEAASIDKQAHACDGQRMLGDLLELQQTIGAVANWCKTHAPETTIVVTSDHATGGFDVYGSVDTDAFRAASDENENNSTAADAARLNSISIYGPSRWPDYTDHNNDGMVDNWDSQAEGGAQHTLAGVNNNHPSYRENYQLKMTPDWLRSAELRDAIPGLLLSGNLPGQVGGSSSAVHTSSDVMVFASGPGSAFFGRSLDNTEIFFGIAAAVGASRELGAPPPSPAAPIDGNVLALGVTSSLLAMYAGALTFFAVRWRTAAMHQLAEGAEGRYGEEGGSVEEPCAEKCWNLVRGKHERGQLVREGSIYASATAPQEGGLFASSGQLQGGSNLGSTSLLAISQTDSI